MLDSLLFVKPRLCAWTLERSGRWSTALRRHRHRDGFAIAAVDLGVRVVCLDPTEPGSHIQVESHEGIIRSRDVEIDRHGRGSLCGLDVPDGHPGNFPRPEIRRVGRSDLEWNEAIPHPDAFQSLAGPRPSRRPP